MAGFQVPNLAYLRNIPVIGARLYEALHGAQQAINTMAVQGNLNPTGQIEPPPAIQSVSAVGKNGVLHVSIEHTAADVKRGVRYYIEHADNPAFTNPQIRQIGDSRSYSEFVGAQQRYVKAYAAYPGSAAGPSVYHGGAASPQPIDGGGAIGPAEYLPSQGSGTSAPGQGGVGPGPIQVRTDSSGFDWRLQRPIASGAASQGNSPGSMNGIGAEGGSGGGGGGGLLPTEGAIASCEWLSSVSGTNTITASTTTKYAALSSGFLVRFVPANTSSSAVTLNVNATGAKAVTKNGTTALSGGELVAGKTYLLVYDGTRWQIVGIIGPASALVLASDANGVPIAAVLADTKIWIGNGSSVPAAQSISGDATLANTGALTLATVNASPGTYTNATITVNAKGLVTSASSGSGGGSTGSWTPGVSFGSGTTGITYGAQSGTYFSIGGMVFAYFDITLTSKGSSTGIAEVTGLPVASSATFITGGTLSYAENMLVLSATPTLLASVGTANARLLDFTATGGVNLTDTNFTNTSRIVGMVMYYS